MPTLIEGSKLRIPTIRYRQFVTPTIRYTDNWLHENSLYTFTY